MIYMDYNATAPVLPEVMDAMLPYFRDRFGNASSIHAAGRRVKAAVDDAREKIAAFVGCAANEVVFTSSGSESDNMAIKGVCAEASVPHPHIITTRVEHPAVLKACAELEKAGCTVTWLNVDQQGRLDPTSVEEAITGQTVLISIMAANNETGTLFPIQDIGRIAQKHAIPFHCDAVQWVGRKAISCVDFGIRLMSMSGHKIGAPQGIGALIVRDEAKMSALIHGGAQERNRRAGTENVAGIVGLGKACDIAHHVMRSRSKYIQELRDKLEQGILATIPDVSINGDTQNRLPNTTNIAFGGVATDSLLTNLDLAGIAASAGSACSSGALKPSHVLSAMGVDVKNASIRFSLGPDNTAHDVAFVLEKMPPMIERLRH